MLEGVLSMQNLISDPVSMTSCRQEAYLLRLRRQFPFVYVKTLTRTAFGRSVYALQFGSGSRKLLITAGHHANETITSDAVWQWLFTFCNALLDGRTVCGAEARELYHNAMVYLVPLVNPDGADLAAGVCAPGSPEYRAAADIAAQYPRYPVPVRLEGESAWGRSEPQLSRPVGSGAAHQKRRGACPPPAPRDFAGFSPLDQPETAALAAFTRCIHPELMLALHTQGLRDLSRPGGSGSAGRSRLAQAFSDASGYPVEPVPPESANAGFKDWFLQVFKRPAFTIEAGLGENPLPTSQLPEITRAPQRDFYRRDAVVRYPENHNFLILHTLHRLWYTEDRNEKGVQRFMHEYEVLIETINPCGGEAHAAREFKQIEAASPEAYVAAQGRYPVLDSGKNASGDTVITTGDGKGVMIRYTFTE